ncbi:MAG: hypothetical protein H0W85_06200 [Methylotenera sp.]|nr:hypothetical protein [Methylotenera sp.]
MFGSKHLFVPETQNSIPSQLFNEHYDALEILSDSQQEILDLFRFFKNSTSVRDRKILIPKIYNALTVYARIEHEIFYPTLRRALQQKDSLPELQLSFDPLFDLITHIDFKNPDLALHEQNIADLEKYFSLYIEAQKNEVFVKLDDLELDFASLGKRIIRRKMELSLLKSLEVNCPYP